MFNPEEESILLKTNHRDFQDEKKSKWSPYHQEAIGLLEEQCYIGGLALISISYKLDIQRYQWLDSH